MTTAVRERPRTEYGDMAFAIECIERRRLRELRESAGLNKNELARRVDVPWAYIHRWERYDVRPTLDNLDVLARYGRELRRLAREAKS